jgi:hypothetical protein
MIADCILGADFLNKFQVTVSFKDQCMYTNDKKGSRQHQFVSEEMSTVELKEETLIREIKKSTIGGEEGESGCKIEGKGDRRDGVLASDVACDSHRLLLKVCNDDSVKKSRDFMQNRTICANASTDAVDTRAIQNSELLRKVEEASRLSTEQKTKLFNVLLRYKKFFTSKPGRCDTFQYKFKVSPEGQLVGHSRPIPFTVRSTVRAKLSNCWKIKSLNPQTPATSTHSPLY